METNLSQRTAKQLGQLNSLPKESLGKVCKYFLQSLIKGSSNIQLADNLDDVLCAISTVLLESAKIKSSEDQLKALLVEHGVNGEICGILAELYGQQKDILVQHMEATGINAPIIVGIEWRLDHSIRSKNTGRESAPMFYVSLRVKDRSILRDITMVATLEELQDMLSKVRDAVKQVDRILHMQESA